MAVAVPDLAPLIQGDAGGPPALDARIAAADHPLALLPVRLESRFFARPDGGVELRVRIYPDKIHIDAHDPALGPDEIAWTQRYWRTQWRAGSDDQRLRQAWAMLAGRFGSPRAAYLVAAMAPTNPADRPATTLDPDAALPVPPAFGDVGPPPAPTRPAAVARLLPDRWLVTAYTGGAVAAVVTGRDIAADLAVGPDLGAPAVMADDSAPIDRGMAWMTDFDTAEAAGMAVRVPLPGPLASAAVDVLLVTGVVTAGGDAAGALARQLDAHHYTDGLAFVPPGAPSNNTPTDRTGYRADGPPDGYDVEIAAGHVDPLSNAGVATRALGLGADTLARVASATDREEPLAAATATVAWPVTWGYFLAQVIGFDGTGLTVAGRDWAQEHALAHLRPGGALPVLRCGRQPYGLLPATCLDLWTPATDADAGATRLRDVLVTLRDRVWRPAAAGVARVGRSDDPAADLVDVLASAPLSTGYLVRGALGRHFAQHLAAFVGEVVDAGFWSRLAELGAREPVALGLGTPAFAEVAFDPAGQPVTAPVVAADGAPPTYLAALAATTDVDALAARTVDGGAALLHVLARHALLREYAEAAARLLDAPGTPLSVLLRDVELPDLVPGAPPAPTWTWLRTRTAPGTSSPVGQQLATLVAAGAPTPPTRSLLRFRAALADLADHAASADGVRALERHLAGALDTTSHRLDAWVTSLAGRRLAEMRASTPDGVAVGGYGWLTNLRPEPAITAPGAVPDEPGPLRVPADDPGFVHAPSINQAAAAAMLRNAHLAHGGTAEGPYAVNLSSARIRLARHLVAGLRQGQPLPALLGYLVERALGEAGLHTAVDDLRAAFPLPGTSATTGRGLVVDGLALVRAWQRSSDDVLALLRGLAATDPRRPVATRILGALQQAVDATADAATAEAAFQLARGNPARAAASMDAVSGGQSPPPDLAFLATPRTGVELTHRVAVVLDADPGPGPSGWADAASARAQADPALDAWAGRVLGPVDGVSVPVEELTADGVVAATHPVPFGALGLRPVDLVWACSGTGPDAGAEVVARVLDAARHQAGVPAGATLRVNPGRGPNAGRGIADLIELGTQLRRLLEGSRGLDGADFQPPHAAPRRGLDLAEYAQRAATAERALRATRDALGAALTAPDPAGRLRTALQGAAGFGVTAAVPGTVEQDPAMRTQAVAVLAELDRRLARSAALPTGPDPASDPPSDAAGRDRLLARLRAVFGDTFLAVPRFTVPDATDVAASRADPALLAGDPLAAYTWLHLMERVRAPLSRLTRPLAAAEVLGTGAALDLSVVQVPFTAGRPWIGLVGGASAAIPAGCAAVVMQGAPDDLGGALCGLLVDAWTEVVPHRNETTGLAFRYDPPDACPPQAILLAVPPVIGEAWRLRTLNRLLLETLDLARIRTVEPAALGAVAQYLPAAYLAFNAAGEAVSSDLGALTAPPADPTPEEPFMPSITTWWRVEPRPPDAGSEDGYAARVHDPLWLLARQWQVGEFAGQDGGTPVTARWRARVAPMTRYHPGPIAPNTQLQAPALDADLPWQTLVERQPSASPAPGDVDGLRWAVEAGQHFLRLLRLQATAADHGPLLRTAFAVPPLTDAQRARLDPDTVAFADLVAGRALDGRRLRAALGDPDDPQLDPSLGLPAADVAEVREACRAWLRWSAGLVTEPAGDDAWQPDRMEYSFSLSTRLGDDVFGERTLTAAAFADGALDWYSFDLNGEVNMGTGADAPGGVLTRTAVPAPVTFRGMPATRFWEFEDARIDLGSVQFGATDLAQLLTVEALTGYGNDWFIVPIELPVGSLSESRSLVVTDTFGTRTLLRPTGDPALGPDRGWSMFSLAMPVEPGDPTGVAITNLFLLAPAVPQLLEGPALEEVALVRDELANVAWGIERRLESPLGVGVETVRPAPDPVVPPDPVVAEPSATGPAYRLASTVPQHWIPLIPVLVEPGGAEVRLACGSILDTDGSPHVVEAQARLLAPVAGRPLLVREEEVPREGVVVRRVHRATRQPDGRLLVWSANTATVGRGELSSGLAFDDLTPATPAVPIPTNTA